MKRILRKIDGQLGYISAAVFFLGLWFFQSEEKILKLIGLSLWVLSYYFLRARIKIDSDKASPEINGLSFPALLIPCSSTELVLCAVGAFEFFLFVLSSLSTKGVVSRAKELLLYILPNSTLPFLVPFTGNIKISFTIIGLMTYFYWLMIGKFIFKENRITFGFIYLVIINFTGIAFLEIMYRIFRLA